MAITQRTILKNRIASCIRLDKKDPTNLRVAIDELIVQLHAYNVFVPPKQFELLIKRFLEEKVVGQVTLGSGDIVGTISDKILTLAESLIRRAELSAATAHMQEISRIANTKDK